MKGVLLALFLPLAYRLQSPPAKLLLKQGLLPEDSLTLRNKGKNYTLVSVHSIKPT
jgi:hypothetical protein